MDGKKPPHHQVSVTPDIPGTLDEATDSGSDDIDNDDSNLQLPPEDNEQKQNKNDDYFYFDENNKLRRTEHGKKRFFNPKDNDDDLSGNSVFYFGGLNTNTITSLSGFGSRVKQAFSSRFDRLVQSTGLTFNNADQELNTMYRSHMVHKYVNQEHTFEPVGSAVDSAWMTYHALKALPIADLETVDFIPPVQYSSIEKEKFYKVFEHLGVKTLKNKRVNKEYAEYLKKHAKAKQKKQPILAKSVENLAREATTAASDPGKKITFSSSPLVLSPLPKVQEVSSTSKKAPSQPKIGDDLPPSSLKP